MTGSLSEVGCASDCVRMHLFCSFLVSQSALEQGEEEAVRNLVLEGLSGMAEQSEVLCLQYFELTDAIRKMNPDEGMDKS